MHHKDKAELCELLIEFGEAYAEHGKGSTEANDAIVIICKRVEDFVANGPTFARHYVKAVHYLGQIGRQDLVAKLREDYDEG
jgi:hypothetical protein